jgi:hypothetical protein
MLLRKNTVKSRNESMNSQEEFRTKTAQSLTELIRRRSTLNKVNEVTVVDEMTPATNKLVSMLRAPRINQTVPELLEDE